MRALEGNDTAFLRGLSLYYMGTSGIYQRLVEYMSTILTYDWYAYPHMVAPGTPVEGVEEDLNKVLSFLDESKIPTMLRNISQIVIAEGVFYGYLVVDTGSTASAMLELPADYCRSQFNVNGLPAVEFNLAYFDDQFRNEDLRDRVLDSYPKEFRQNYDLFKSGEIAIDPTDRGAWFVCDTNMAMKFSLTTNDAPMFAAVIPTIINLDEAKQLDLTKTTQELLKIIIQKMPIDRNGDLIFDIEESQIMHNTAASMLQNANNVDILTTFAEIDVADLDNSTGMSTNDPLVKVERGVFNEAGVSRNLFATDGNLSLEKSIQNDEAIMFELLDKYEEQFNNVIDTIFNKNSVVKMKFPHLTIYNQEKKQQTYRELATNGYSKLLPAIAAGHTQTEFLSLLEYESKVLHLDEKLVPVQSSNTMSGSAAKGSNGDVGAPKKDQDDLAEKTIQNQESQN